MANVNLHSSQSGANGTNNSSTKFLGGFPSSKMGSAALRSVSNRKGQQLPAESFDEGDAESTISEIEVLLKSLKSSIIFNIIISRILIH